MLGQWAKQVVGKRRGRVLLLFWAEMFGSLLVCVSFVFSFVHIMVYTVYTYTFGKNNGYSTEYP